LLPLPRFGFAALGLSCRFLLASPCFFLGAFLGPRLFYFLFAETLPLIRLGFRRAVQLGMGRLRATEAGRVRQRDAVAAGATADHCRPVLRPSLCLGCRCLGCRSLWKAA